MLQLKGVQYSIESPFKLSGNIFCLFSEYRSDMYSPNADFAKTRKQMERFQ